MKTKFARYLSQLGRFGRESISKHSGPTATNSEQTSFSRSLTRGKMRMKCGRVYEKNVYEGTQNTPTVEKTCPTWCGSNATNSNQSKGFSLFGFSWLPTSRQISTNSAFEYTAICRIWFTFRRHETIWLRRQATSSLQQVRDIASKTCTHAFQKQQNLIFIRKLPFKVHQPIAREFVDRRKCVE